MVVIILKSKVVSTDIDLVILSVSGVVMHTVFTIMWFILSSSGVVKLYKFTIIREAGGGFSTSCIFGP